MTGWPLCKVWPKGSGDGLLLHVRQSIVLHYIDDDDDADDDDNADVNSARRNAFSAIDDELDDGDVGNDR